MVTTNWTISQIFQAFFMEGMPAPFKYLPLCIFGCHTDIITVTVYIWLLVTLKTEWQHIALDWFLTK
jgi:hypothetical protein